MVNMIVLIALVTTLNEISALEPSLLGKSCLSGDTLKLDFVELNEQFLTWLLSIMYILYHKFNNKSSNIFAHLIGAKFCVGFI